MPAFGRVARSVAQAAGGADDGVVHGLEAFGPGGGRRDWSVLEHVADAWRERLRVLLVGGDGAVDNPVAEEAVGGITGVDGHSNPARALDCRDRRFHRESGLGGKVGRLAGELGDP